MAKATLSTEFACDPARLFDLLCDWPGHVRWQPTLAEATQQGPLVLGTRIVETRVAFAQRLRSTYEVSTFEPGRQIVTTSLDGPMRAQQSYLVEQAPAGSRLTMSYELDPPLMLRMFEQHFVPQITAELQHTLENLGLTLRGEESQHQSWVWQPT